LQHFKAHESVLAAIEFFRQWLAAAAAGHPCPAKKAMGQLHDRGGTPELMLQWVLTCALYSRRIDSVASRTPFAIFNCALKGYVAAPRGWLRKGHVASTYPQMNPGYNERKEGANYIRANLRFMIPEVYAYIDRKEILFNERALALQGKFPVLRTRRGKVDPRCRAERAKEGSPFHGPGNPTGVNQYTRAVDPVTERKAAAPKPPGRFGPIPYFKAKKEKEPHAKTT
jgi:hypothetical protein